MFCPTNSRELLDETCRIANALKRKGVKKGDRVCIYMPVSPTGVASMLACARIGAIHRYGGTTVYKLNSFFNFYQEIML